MATGALGGLLLAGPAAADTGVDARVAVRVSVDCQVDGGLLGGLLGVRATADGRGVVNDRTWSRTGPLSIRLSLGG